MNTRTADDISLSNEASRGRYELAVGGALAAFAEYRAQPGGLEFVHTEVLPQYAGRGLGQKLAQFALADARGRGLQVAASCSFMARYIERHPQGAQPAGGAGNAA